MRTIKNLVGLLFFASLLVTYSPGLKAFEPIWCDDDPQGVQNGAVCEYESLCGFDGTPGTEYSPWEEHVDFYQNYCGSTPYDINPTVIEWEIYSYCDSFANARGDAFGYVTGGGVTAGPYEVDIPDVFVGYCVDGAFACHFTVEGPCS